MWTSREIIELVGPRIPGACVSPEARSNLEALSGRLPDVFSSYYLECRLSAGQEQVDFLACAAESTDHHAARRIRAADGGATDDRERDPAWRFTWDVLCRWAGPSGEWLETIPFVWLEFDHLSACPPARQSPSIGVCVDPGYPDRRITSDPGEPRDPHEICLSFLTPAVPAALDGLLSAGNRRALMDCFQRLPPGGRIIHVSFMAARDPATVKLYGAIPEAHLTSYLSDIGWPGSLESLRHLTRTFCTSETADDTVYLDLSLDGALLPHAAFTFSQPQLRRPACSDPRRTALLGLLQRHGLSAPDKSEALRTWPGSDRESHPSGSISARIHRWLDVKITLHAEQGIGAKGYLGFAPVLSMF